jgi:hypothetical protein
VITETESRHSDHRQEKDSTIQGIEFLSQGSDLKISLKGETRVFLRRETKIFLKGTILIPRQIVVQKPFVNPRKVSVSRASLI